MSRLPTGGQVDRTQQIRFSFDGTTYLGHGGDTLASALLANDVRLVARSFKYHRPRGILTAGSEEPNALMTLGAGDQITPNVRATTQEIFHGLVAHSQNRFPSLSLDLMSINDLFAPFLSAGFYYKTFMWPKSFWERLYEPIIRRAAGLGALSGAPDAARYDKAFAHCDLLIIGAGPAGLMAALVAGKAGLDVIVANEDHVIGGRLNSETHEVGGTAGADWAARTAAKLRDMPNVRLMGRTTVTGAYDGGSYGALERVSTHLAPTTSKAPLEIFWRITAARVILASGAIERPIAFPNNDRPGVMMAAAVRSYVNRFAVAAGRNVSIFTNNDDGHQTARDLVAKGVHVAAVIDTRSDISPSHDYKVLSGAEVIDTKGRKGLSEITVRAPDGISKIKTDCLAVSGGWNPAVHLTSHLGAKPVWQEDIAAFVPPQTHVPGMMAVGAAAGIFSTYGALQSGAHAAKEAVRDLGGKNVRLPVPKAEDAPVSITPFWHVTGGKGRAWLDFQNDVTTKDVALAHRENFRSVEHMKRYTTLGMATDQGKTANIGAMAVMAELTGRTLAETGTTTFRPPYTPVSLGALGAHGRGKEFAPVRLIPTDAMARAAGAEMTEVGLWYRPSWFARAGENHWRQSCDREVAMVRTRVGICDVTTLGKIDVQGKDAAEFLNRVYTGRISSLKVGRVRYGLMLREDGMVMDDGTVSRLGARHFLLTTTTGAAGAVMTHLEFCAQVLWPQLDVRCVSVTEQWAQFAVAGPRARDLLADLVATDISDEILPFMGWCEVKIGKVKSRLYRISYCGELGYELAIPSGFGAALAAELTERATQFGGDWYGLEALNVLRLEKGYLTHAEIDGRVTADDLGMGRMIASGKDCIGKTMSQRAGLCATNRAQLVGLKPDSASKRLHGGAHLFTQGDAATRENDQGHIASQCFSPTLGHPIALAFVKSGRARMGETLRMVDHLRKVETLCEICSPVFVDPEGEKLRG